MSHIKLVIRVCNCLILPEVSGDTGPMGLKSVSVWLDEVVFEKFNLDQDIFGSILLC